MSTDHRVLILGATGRTGGHVLTQLLERRVPARAIVRSSSRPPAGAGVHPLLEVIEADLLGMPAEDLAAHRDGCDTVISCLGHTVSARGLFGPPHLLVERALRRVRDASRRGHPPPPCA